MNPSYRITSQIHSKQYEAKWKHVQALQSRLEEFKSVMYRLRRLFVVNEKRINIDTKCLMTVVLIINSTFDFCIENVSLTTLVKCLKLMIQGRARPEVSERMSLAYYRFLCRR